MKRRRGPKAAHVVGGILAFLLLATMAACGGASVPTTAPPQPAPPSAPPPALPTQPVLPMAPPGTGPVQASPTVPPIQTTTATPAPSPSVEPQPRPTLPTTQPSPVLPAATPTTATRTPFPPPPPPPWPLITLPPGTPGVMVVEPNPESVLGILPASWASVFFAQLGRGRVLRSSRKSWTGESTRQNSMSDSQDCWHKAPPSTFYLQSTWQRTIQSYLRSLNTRTRGSRLKQGC